MKKPFGAGKNPILRDLSIMVITHVSKSWDDPPSKSLRSLPNPCNPALAAENSPKSQQEADLSNTLYNGLSVCFQTHGEEVFGPQRTYRKHWTSGGIWKTRVLFFVYVYHFESFVATCVPGTNVVFFSQRATFFLQRFLKETFSISLIVWKIPKTGVRVKAAEPVLSRRVWFKLQHPGC